MATDVKLPRLGQGMESGVIVRWLKAEGDAIAKGEPLYELDTDKVTQEVEAELDGVLTKIVVPEGEVEVGATIALVETNGDARSATTEAPAEAPAERGSAEPPAERPLRRRRRRHRPSLPSPVSQSRRRQHGRRRQGARQGLTPCPPHRARARRRPGGAVRDGPRRQDPRRGR